MGGQSPAGTFKEYLNAVAVAGEYKGTSVAQDIRRLLLVRGDGETLSTVEFDSPRLNRLKVCQLLFAALSLLLGH